MEDFKPDVVIGCGGYVTYPVIKAAKKLGIKTFIHEQNSIPGKSNIHLSKLVDLVGISFKNSESYFKNAAFIFLFTVSSVSLKYCLLSECPIITYSTFIDFNIFPETSPVYAPFSSKCIF